MWHVFDSDAVDLATASKGKSIRWVFLFGLWPRFVGSCFVSAVCFAVSAGETQVWLGDLRVVALGLVVAFVFVASIDLPTPRTFCPCTLYFLLTLM